MAYLAQKTRASQLTIGGVDYTSSLVSFQVSDSSAFKNGLIITTGEVVLGQRPGQVDIEDYDRNSFRRGASVILDVTEPGGTAYRHPRGQLYVISVSYSVEKEQLTVDVGCRLALASLIDNAESVLPLVPIPLDPAQRTIQNCGASFASAGMVLYQDNQGDLVSRKFFNIDSESGVEAGAWVSVLGETALQAEPLGGGDAIPDKINLSYQVPQGALAGDSTGKVETVSTLSNYFYAYPVTIFTRNPPEDSGVPDGITIPGSPGGGLSGCGNTPSPPSTPPNDELNVDAGTRLAIACSPEWTTDSTTVYLPAERTTVSTTTYGAPGGQVSLRRDEVYGPAIEVQAQYYADKYAYCTSTYGYNCNPNGNCPLEGQQIILQSYSETINEYDESNSLSKTIQDNYVTRLSAARTEDWRSGIIAGRPQDFNQNLDNDTSLYRVSRVVTEYSTLNQVNIQFTTTFTSITSRNVGLSAKANLDALKGIKTTVRRESVTTIPNDLRPDTVNSPTTATDEYETVLLVADSLFQTPPSEAGEYILDEAVPVPLLSTNKAQIETWLNDYSNYLLRFTKGNLYGMRIAESMRSEIVTNWHPGMPFRYVDTANNTISAMRMDACTWGVTQEESIVVTNGVWGGFSSGTLSIGNNLVGNSTPAFGGGSPSAPPAVDAAPAILNDLVGQSFAFEIDVDLWLTADVVTYGADGVVPINPTDMTADVEQAIVPYVSGIIVSTGDLLAPTGTGSIPLEYLGSLVVENATVIDGDVFAA